MNDNKEMVKVNKEDQTRVEEILENERSVAPITDIIETKDDFILVANMPGVSRSDVQLKLEEGSLTIFGKVDYNDLMNNKFVMNESEIGHYFRRFKISDSIDSENIEAKYENGQLIVKLPKHERIKPRTISIK